MTTFVGIVDRLFAMFAKTHYEYRILESTILAISSNVWSNVARNAIYVSIVGGCSKQEISKTKTMNVTIVLTPNGAKVVKQWSVVFISDNWTTNESETTKGAERPNHCFATIVSKGVSSAKSAERVFFVSL